MIRKNYVFKKDETGSGITLRVVGKAKNQNDPQAGVREKKKILGRSATRTRADMG